MENGEPSQNIEQNGNQDDNTTGVEILEPVEDISPSIELPPEKVKCEEDLKKLNLDNGGEVKSYYHIIFYNIDKN